MRFKTFRNFIVVPGGLLLTFALGGALFLLASSASCGSGTTSPTTRSPELQQAQPVTAVPVSQPQRQAASPASRDEKIIALLEAKRNQSGDKIKDAFPRETYKVNIYRDGGSTTWNRLKIDYNRNERWEEKWDLEDGQPVKKHVSTADNDVYDQEYRWQGGQWVKKN